MTMTRALVVLSLAAVLGTESTFAQTPSGGAPSAAVPVTASVAPAAAAVASPSAIPTVAGRTSDAAEPQGFAYNPEGRRDPFVSLLRRGVDSAPPGKRNSGLSGLATAEISLRGTVRSEGAFVGIIEGADRKTYIVRAGDRLSDGLIRAITADTMVILQQVSDPLSLEKVHEVRKLLRQTEEGK
jgi:Tfp pilus assembly protein PilP